MRVSPPVSHLDRDDRSLCEPQRRDLSRFGFYLGLASFKLAGILEGIHYRFLNRQTVGEGFSHVGSVVEPLLQTGLDELDD
jgi:hypothetical protein